MNKVVRNERKKLTATWFNAVATAIMTAGVLAPIVSIIYGFGSKQQDPALIFTTTAICMLVSGSLHLAGQHDRRPRFRNGGIHAAEAAERRVT